MEEKNENVVYNNDKSKIIIIVLVLIILGLVGYIICDKLCHNDVKVEEKKYIDKEVKGVISSQDANQIHYDTWAIDKDGHLNFINVDELSKKVYAEIKDVKFVNTTASFGDVGPGSIYALTNDGRLFEITLLPDVENEEQLGDMEFVTEIKNEFSGKITKLGYFYYGDIDNHLVGNRLVLHVGDKAYVDVLGENVLLDEYKNQLNNYLFVGVEAKTFKNVGYTLNNNIVLDKNVIVKDKSSKKKIVIKYAIYDYEKDDKLYVITEDNKMYVMDKTSEYVESYAEVEKVEVQRNDIIQSYPVSKLIVLLKNGERFIFEE